MISRSNFSAGPTGKVHDLALASIRYFDLSGLTSTLSLPSRVVIAASSGAPLLSSLTRASNGPKRALPKLTNAAVKRMLSMRTCGGCCGGWAVSDLVHTGILSIPLRVRTRESISMRLMMLVGKPFQ